MNHPQFYKGKRVVVLGMARSGVSVAKVFHGFGADVVVNDRKERESCPEASELDALGISVICGGHPDDLVTEGTALLVKNPGIPYSAPPVIEALRLNIPVITEVEVAYYLSPAPIIGITGSNGKTTTTTWIGEMLEAAGLRAIVAGNIGTPLCEAAVRADEDDWIVAELSSFQLKGTNQFKPRIALLLNLAETHLDYHGDMEDYAASKAKIFANQSPADTAVYNADDQLSSSIALQTAGRKFPFSLKQELTEGVYLSPPMIADERGASDPVGIDQMIVWRDEHGTVHEILPVAALGVPGRHNAANAMAAAAACLAAGVKPEQLVKPLQSFRGVEHRLELVREVNGVTYYNDSKATNPTATIMSIGSLKGGIVLIAGGLDRGSDYMELLPVFKSRVKALVTIGETRGKLAYVAELAGLSRVVTVDPLEDADATLRMAVKEAAGLAEAGDVVLLSPACASWDMFTSYEERGRIFKQSAHTL